MATKTHKRFCFILLVVLAISFFYACLFDIAHADVTETLTITSSSYDGYIYEYDVTYSVARDDTSGLLLASTAFLIIGQNIDGPYSYVRRSYLLFDTSAIPVGATIDSAVLSLYIYSDSSTTDFNVTIQNGQPTYPHSPLEAGDYYRTWYGGDGGNRATNDGLSAGAYWNITLSSTGLGWIQDGSTTKLCLRSSNDINNVAPTGEERITAYAREQGESYAPKLYITYTVPEGDVATYVIHGPFYDNGEVLNDTITVSLYRENALLNTYVLDGSSGYEDNETITLGSPATYFSWNVTSTGNVTRVYYLLGESFEELWLFVPNLTEDVYYYYTFTVTDFYGMVNPFMQISKNIDGTQYVIESRSLVTSGTLSFLFQQWQSYTLTFICNQGTYSQEYFADNTFAVSLQVLAGAFPITDVDLGLSAWCNRTSDTNIAIYYVDSNEATIWLYMEITHRSGTTDILDYSSNTTGSSQSLSWTDATAETAYDIYLEAYRSDNTYQWHLTAPSLSESSNPFAGLISALGTFPTGFNPDQIPAAIIIIGVLAIFSVYSSTAGIVLALIVAGVLGVLGFYVCTVGNLIFAAFVAVMAHIGESKKTEREV